MVGINILSGFNNVIIASDRKKIPPLVISSASMGIGGLALFLLSIPVEGLDLSPKPPVYFVALGWLSLLSAVAVSIWLSLLKRPGTKVSDLNLWKFLIHGRRQRCGGPGLPDGCIAKLSLYSNAINVVVVLVKFIIVELIIYKQHDEYKAGDADGQPCNIQD